MSAFRLDERDEYPHTPDASPNFNESVYINAFDNHHSVGGWLRLGNRPNEGYAELSVCLYLPDGKIACQFARPPIAGNDAFSAGGLTVAYQTENRGLDVSYRGELFVLDDPDILRNPRRMFDTSPRVSADIQWNVAPASPLHGGEPDDASQQTMYGRDFSLGHFNQHIQAVGEIRVADAHWTFGGHGWRDHSWGPRFWQAIHAYRLFIANLGDGYGFMLLKISDAGGRSRRLGVLLVNGIYEEIEDLDVRIHWTDARDPSSVWIGARTHERTAIIEGKILSLAPLRNRRQTELGTLETRIAEGLTRFRWNGHRGLGMTEFIERVEDGRYVGFPL